MSIWLVRRNSFYFSYYFKYMNLLHNHFLQIYILFLYTYGIERIGENGPSLMRHIYKRFFSKIEELRNYVKKKNGHRNNAMKKIKNRPILRDKIVLMILFIRSHFVIMHYNKATHKLCFLAKCTESYRVGSHTIERIM